MVMKLVVVMIVLVVVIVVVVLMVMVVSNDGEEMVLLIKRINMVLIIFNIVTMVMYNLAMIANTFSTPLTTNILNIFIPYQGLW